MTCSASLHLDLPFQNLKRIRKILGQRRGFKRIHLEVLEKRQHLFLLLPKQDLTVI